VIFRKSRSAHGHPPKCGVGLGFAAFIKPPSIPASPAWRKILVSGMIGSPGRVGDFIPALHVPK